MLQILKSPVSRRDTLNQNLMAGQVHSRRAHKKKSVSEAPKIMGKEAAIIVNTNIGGKSYCAGDSSP